VPARTLRGQLRFQWVRESSAARAANGGASGYIGGGRLLRALEAAGRPIRCLARHPEFLRSRVSSSTQVIQADCLDSRFSSTGNGRSANSLLLRPFHGFDGAVSKQKTRQAAQNFADSAREQGVKRIVYLGGLGNQDQALSAHLRSRHEVADILRSSAIPTIEISRLDRHRAPEAFSFEMIRALVQRLPVMICPRWVEVKSPADCD